MIAGTAKEIVEKVSDPAEDAGAIDLFEIEVGQFADFQVHLLQIVHRRLPIRAADHSASMEGQCCTSGRVAVTDLTQVRAAGNF